MSNLVRQRRAHDLWISRSHVVAFVLAGVFGWMAAFGLGYVAGRESVEVEPQVAAGFTTEAGGEELVELLARVDAAAVPDGGVRELTFPDALTGKLVDEAPPQGLEVDETVRVDGDAAVDVPERGDVPPKGRWTLAVASVETRAEADALVAGLREKELEAWVGSERIDGATRWRVGVGGWGSRSEAEEALKSMGSKVAVDGAPVAVVRF